MSKEELWVNQAGQIAIYDYDGVAEVIWFGYMGGVCGSTVYKWNHNNFFEPVKDWLKDNEYEFVGYL